jgi:hypothetical protein
MAEKRYTTTPGCVYDNGKFFARVQDVDIEKWNEFQRLANSCDEAVKLLRRYHENNFYSEEVESFLATLDADREEGK